MSWIDFASFFDGLLVLIDVQLHNRYSAAINTVTCGLLKTNITFFIVDLSIAIVIVIE